MFRARSRISITLAAAVAVLSPLLLPGTASAAPAPTGVTSTLSVAGNPDLYTLPGQAPSPGNPAGSKYEGIGLDERRNLFYVSETTGGEISRGRVGDPDVEPWLDGDGKDGRFTARGIDVDTSGRIFIAGGPNSTDHPGAPDLWVYSREGVLLAALNAGAAGAVFNDVTVARDGAAYFTDSSLTPRIFKVVQRNGTWSVELWKDATGTIQTSGPFNLNGIVGTSDGRALIVVQSTGALWRFDLASKEVTPIALSGLTGADLVGGDGIVLRGKKLYVIRNFQHVLVELRMTDQFSGASFVTSVRTDASRVFTTAKYAHGRLLAVDSKFDDPVAAPPYQVVALRLP
jgi:Cu-Zn family superoxide dismutase